MTYFKTAFIAGLIAATAGCSKAQDASAKAGPPIVSKPSAHSAHGYKKPSAPIDITSSFSGQGAVGVVDILNLNVTSRLPGGKVEFEILPSEGLKVFQNNTLTQNAISIDRDSGYDLALQFQPLTEGIHNVTVLTKVYLPNGQFMSKSHTIPVYVGESFQPTKQSLTKEVVGAPNKAGTGLVVMEAEETIE